MWVCESITEYIRYGSELFTKFNADAGVQSYASKLLNSFKLDSELNMRSMRNTGSKYGAAVILEWKKFHCWVFRMRDKLRNRSGEKEKTSWISLNQEQSSLIEELIAYTRANIASGKDELFDRKALQLGMSFIAHRVFNDYDSALVCYVATNAMNSQKKHLRDVTEYTPPLSRIITAMQLTTGVFCFKKADQNKLIENPDHFKSKEEDKNTFYPLLEDNVRKWLSNNKPSPAMVILNQRALFMSIARNSVIGKSGHWDKDGQTITYRKTVISLKQIEQFIFRSLKELKDILYNDLLFGKQDFPSINISEIKDDLGNRDPGYFFGIDQRNPELREARSWLLLQISTDPVLRRKFLKSGLLDDPSFNNTACKEYEAKVMSFLEHLFIVIHLGSGQPARGTEIAGIQFRNEQQAVRALFVINGEICFNINYNKSQSIKRNMTQR